MAKVNALLRNEWLWRYAQSDIKYEIIKKPGVPSKEELLALKELLNNIAR